MLNKETIIVSDINIDYKDRKNYDKHRLAKGLRGMNFKQLVDLTARPVSKTCLDHVYCNQPQRINFVTSADIGLADHLPVFVVRKYARENLNRQSSRMKYRDMKSFDKDQFKRTVEQIPWETAFVFEDLMMLFMLGRRCLILPSMIIVLGVKKESNTPLSPTG